MTSEKNFIREGWDVISTTLGMEIIRRMVEGWRYLFIRLLSYRQCYFIYIYVFFFSPPFFHLCLIQRSPLAVNGHNTTSLKFFIRIEMQCFTRGLRNIAVTYTISLGFICMFYAFVRAFFNTHKEEDIISRNFVLDFCNVHTHTHIHSECTLR